MKLCKDCRYGEKVDMGAVGVGSAFFYWQCRRAGPDVEKGHTDPVTGEPQITVSTPPTPYCSFEREHGWLTSRLHGYCGAEARFFAPKT